MRQKPSKNRLLRLVKGIPLSRVLVVPFLLQISLAVGLIGYLSFRNEQKAVNEVSSELRRGIANRVDQNLQTFLSTPHQVLHSNQNALQLGLVNMQDLTAWEPFLMQQLEIFPPAAAIAISNEQREHLSVEKLSNNNFLIKNSGKSNNYELYSYKIDNRGKRTQLPEVGKNFDPRSRPFYQRAVSDRRFGFSPILIPLTDKTLLLSANEPIYDSQGKLLGVSNTLTRLSQIADNLRNIKVGKSGQIVIMQPSGLLVASSTGEEPVRIKNGLPSRLAVSQSSNSLTQATFEYLSRKFGNLNRIQSLQQLEFSFRGQRQFLEVRPFEGKPDVDWIIAVVIPEADFMEEINRHAQITILLCLAAFALTAVLAILISRWIAQSVMFLNIAAKALAIKATTKNLAKEKKSAVIVQGIAELEVLAQSFNQMTQELQTSFTELTTANEELELRVEQRNQELQQEIQERIHNERRLRQHSLALAELANYRAVANGDLETACKFITEKAANALAVERVSIWLYNSNRTKLQCVDLYESSQNKHSAGLERNRADYPVYFQALASARTMTVSDTRKDPRVQEFWDDLLEPKNIVALIDAPILAGAEVVGMVFHEQVKTPRQWELSEQNFVGAIADFVALTLEVSDRQRAEVALRQAKEAAEVANRAKSNFLGNMSYELRTPLNSILGITEALQDQVFGPLTKEQRQSLSTIEHSGQHLLELINNMLNLAKIESGKMDLELTPTSIQKLCDSSLGFVKQLAFKKNIQLSTEIPEDIGTIQVDQRRMQQLLINLLSNAVKFTPEGGEVWLEVQPVATQERIYFSVVDTGIGIEPENLPNLFQPFVQVQNSYTRRYGGAGLGLSLVRQIAELHGGSVAVYSQLDKGSRFTVTLPWKQVENQE
jgi:signal transduction histidine kinase/HAMP domain-containing protein